MKKHSLPLCALCALTIGIATAPNAHAELIGYWPMDDTTGDVATATFGFDATWQSPGNNLGWVTGEIGNAADLGGQNAAGNYFSVDLNSTLLSTTELTIALWVNPDAFTGDNYEGLFVTRSANGTGLNGTAIGNGNWGLAWQEGTGGDGVASSGHLDTRTSGSGRSAANSLIAGSWYHVALVWDGVAGTHVQYINGVATDEVGATGPLGEISGGVWHIGNDSCCANRFFDGQIDDVAVWDEALSAADIGELFAKTKSPSDIGIPQDQDDDMMPDDYENMFPGFLDPLVKDADEDVDRVGGVIGGALMPDGLTNIREREAGTDPRDPDSDDDGLLDGEEVDTYFTFPLVADSDGDNILDGEEVVAGADGFVTDPLKADTDDDLIDDDVEIASIPQTDPTNKFSPAPPPLPTGDLVALYRFDETEGDIAFDSAVDDGAQDATTTLGEVAWRPGLIGGGVFFGSGDIMKAADALGAGTTAFSISGWVNLAWNRTYAGIFMSRPDNWGLATEDTHFDLRFDNPGAGDTSQGLDTAENSAPTRVWHHLAITWTSDGANSLGTTYLNGAQVSTTTTSATTYLEDGVEWFIGSDSNRRLTGDLDDISVWRRELSADEIAAIYRNGQLGIGVGLPADVDFRITAIELQANGDVKLTWNSEPAAETSYAVLYNRDLSTPTENWADADDGVPTGGTSTSFTIPAATLKPDPTVDEPDPAPYPDMFFKVRENPPTAAP